MLNLNRHKNGQPAGQPNMQPMGGPNPGAPMGQQGQPAGPGFTTPMNRPTYSSPSTDPEVGKDPNARVKLLSRLTAGLAAVTLISVGFGGYSLVSTSAQKAELDGSSSPTVVAKKAITAGTTITADMLEIVKVPAKYRSADAVETADNLIGHPAATEISSGAQVGSAQVIGSDDASQLSHRIAKDKVAITIDTTTASGLAGGLSIGDKVNVITYSTTTVGDEGSFIESSSCETVVENAKVTALGGVSADVSSDYASVTLEVSEDEAKKIKEASQDSIDLVLKPTVTQSTKTTANGQTSANGQTATGTDQNSQNSQNGTSTQSGSAESSYQAVSNNGK